MHILVDLHTHTLASGHAYSTAYENILFAKRNGLQGLAITDHGPAMPNHIQPWFFESLRFIEDELEGLRVFRGMEANIINEYGDIDASKPQLKNLNLVLAALHVVTIPEHRDMAYYTAAACNAMRNPRIAVLAHPDDGRMPLYYKELVATAGQTHTLLEVNNHSLGAISPRPNARENCRTMLAECHRQGVPVVVNTDAHFCARVGLFDNALRMLEECDFPEELVANTSLEKLLTHLQRKPQPDTTEL